jgi:DHA2 family metal-tetracycline-proton antiporter-like MFS transporter
MNGANAVTQNNGEKLLRVLVFTLIISVMNATMFNVVLPVLSSEFQLIPSQVSWVLTSYMIVYAVGSVTFGKLADKFRLKDLLTFGLIFFALGSIIGLFASHYWMIIVGRILQATGASVIPATAMIVPVRYFTPEKRGRALGTTAIGLSLGAAIGPIVAGFVTSVANWRFLFVLPILALFTLPFFRKYLDDEKGVTKTIDFIGGALLAGTVSLLLLAVTQANWLLLLGGLGLLVLFLIRIRFAKEPFIQPSIFKNRQYSAGLMVAFAFTALNFGLPFISPQLLAHVHHLSPGNIGFYMFPAAICSALLGRLGGRLADHKGNPYLVAIGVASLVICFFFLSSFAGLSPIVFMIFLIFGNIGQTFMQIAMSNTISRTLQKEQIGVGMGLFSMLSFISGAVATTLIGKVLDFGIPSFQLNPFSQSQAALIYSNIFLVLAAMVVVVALPYYREFGKVSRRLS